MYIILEEFCPTALAAKVSEKEKEGFSVNGGVTVVITQTRTKSYGTMNVYKYVQSMTKADLHE